MLVSIISRGAPIAPSSIMARARRLALVRVSCSLGRVMGQWLPVGKLMSRS
jgi:hypothetical protein